jgi:molybdate transport system substrate-binding protein
MTTMPDRIRARAAATGMAVLIALAVPRAAGAAEVTVLCSNGIRAVMQVLVPQFEKATGHHVAITYGLAAALKRQIDAGEPFDLAILTPQFIDEAIEKGSLVRQSRTVLARAGMALAIRKGAARPDIATTDALKRTLLGSVSIAFAKEGAAGTFFVALIERLGLARDLQPKLKPVATGVDVAASVASGAASLGIMPLSEILPAPGVEVLGPFPPDVQSYLIMVAATRRDAPQSAAAGELIRFVSSPSRLAVLKANGMERN